MKIAYYISGRTTFPPSPSEFAASSTVVFNIVRHIADRHDITIYAPEGSQMDGVRIENCSIKPFKIDSSLSNGDWTTKAVIGMKQIFLGKLFENAHKYDIIHLHTEPIYMAMPYVKLIKTPVIFTSHNLCQTIEHDIFRYFDGKVLLTALSKSQASLIPHVNRIPVIYNGVEIEKFNYNESPDNYFLFLGRMVEDKGIDMFLDFAEKNKHINFIVAGKGKKTFEDRATSLSKTNKNISYVGMLPYMSPEWLKTLSNAKALIMPVNYDDSCPLVPLESMACGTPVIAFNRGALSEEIDDEVTGYITKKNTIDELLESVNKLNSHTEQDYIQMRRNARTRIEKHFSSKEMALNYENLYRSIIGKQL